MMSWWGGRKEEQGDPEASSSSKKSKKAPNHHHLHRRRLGGAVAAGRGGGLPLGPVAEDSSTAATSATAPSSPPNVLVNETVTGIEVSFSDEVRSASSSRGGGGGRPSSAGEADGGGGGDDDFDFAGGGGGPIPSVRCQLAARRKVHRAQFRTTAAAGVPPSPPSNGGVAAPLPPDWGPPGRHRVPLFRRRPQPQTQQTPPPPALRYQDALFALRSLEVRDEAAFVRDEVDSLTREIRALEGDRAKLVRHMSSATAAAAPPTAAAQPPATPSPLPLWDLYKLLASSSSDNPAQEASAGGSADRALWQERRGLCLTASLHNPAAREALLSKCGSTATALRAAGSSSSSSVVHILPDNCRDGGAAATIQHIALLSGLTPTESGGFFLSRDASSKGKSYYWGHLPDRLFRRMKNAGMDPRRHACDNLAYLSTGPLGSYYAEFRSGERWWGSPAEDAEFHALCGEWDVIRAVFGPASTLVDARGQHHVATSWIVLGRDGRAAWKNLPARLHRRLERRLASETAPAEVSLGGCGSYFVRFYDGSTDYCLPAAAAQVCRTLESEGRTLTSVALHPDLPHDFVVRHT